jgi:hypothetical protein
MNKRLRIFIPAGLSIISLILVLWLNATLTEEFFESGYLNDRNAPGDLATAFAIALRLNQESAYEMADPILWPRLDNWMETHEVRKCELRGLLGEYLILGPEGGSDRGVEIYEVFFYCDYSFGVADIVVIDGQVVDWGEIIGPGHWFSNGG